MPTFTPFLPRCHFLPRQAFYPNFTPFAILCALRLPRFYPRGKTAHFLLVHAKSRFATSGAHQRARPLTGTRICQFSTHSQLPNVRRIVWKESGYTAQSLCAEIYNFSVKFQLASSLVQQTSLECYTVCFSCFSSTHDVSTMLTQR